MRVTEKDFWRAMAIVLFSCLFSIDTLSAFQNKLERPNLREGIYFTHPFSDKEDLSSDQKIMEYRNANGLSLSFSRKIDKPVCLSETCRPLSLYVIWDGAGNFKELKFLENEPLTKTDHTEFTEADYEKLQGILSDSSSILGTLNKDDLIFEKNKELLEAGVDAYAGATKPSLYNAVVRDAVYTCHALWHTVYGATQEKIREILDQKANTEYLKLVFDGKESNYLVWGIDYLEKHPVMHLGFYESVVGCINSNDPALSQKALNYFSLDRLANIEIQEVLIKNVKNEKQLDVIWKLSELDEVDSKSIYLLLENYNNGKMDMTALNYAYKLITDEHLNYPYIQEKLNANLNDDNRYVRNITNKVLQTTNKE